MLKFDSIFQYSTTLLDPQLWPEGSYELGSFHLSLLPSALLSSSFLGISSLVFSETLCGVSDSYVDVRVSLIFLEKSTSSKNDQSVMAKNVLFYFLAKSIR